MNNFYILSILFINQIGIVNAQLPTTTFATPQSLKVGTYSAPGTINNNSWRYIVRQENRFCVEIGNGPASGHAGTIEVLVSSLSIVNNKLKIDGMGQYIIKEQIENVDYYHFGEPDQELRRCQTEFLRD